jgi:hypothetical protein
MAASSRSRKVKEANRRIIYQGRPEGGGPGFFAGVAGYDY